MTPVSTGATDRVNDEECKCAQRAASGFFNLVVSMRHYSSISMLAVIMNTVTRP
jgi:hypothetical protein